MILEANKCVIVNVDLEEDKSIFKKVFPNKKYAKPIVSYGLEYDGGLVEILSLGNSKSSKYYEWEILNDHVKDGYEINGGLKKLWDHFIEDRNPINVIVSSDEENTRYIDSCGFKNIHSFCIKKEYRYNGVWNSENKIINSAALNNKGVKILLDLDKRDDQTNEEALFELGFVKEEYYSFMPQTDGWFAGGVVYKMEIVGTDKFYIGSTTKNLESYFGSGVAWREYLVSNNIPMSNDFIKKTILYTCNTDYQDLCNKEIEYIQQYCHKVDGKWALLPEYEGRMLNKQFAGKQTLVFGLCEECGGVRGRHKATCSKANKCPECGALNNLHKRTCSHFKARRKSLECPECGARMGQHLKTCSHYIKPDACPECGVVGGMHLKTCSYYVAPKTCEECGAVSGNHKPGCSKYVDRNRVCPECGCGAGHHYKTCSKYVFKGCPECGSPTTHKKWCSRYKEKVCSECGGKAGRHYATCSKYVDKNICSECGGKKGFHKKGCSLYKEKAACPECGGRNGGHYKSCSKYNVNIVCEECGGKNGHHTNACSKHVAKPACSECGGSNGNHKKGCSKYNRKPRRTCKVYAKYDGIVDVR